MTEADDGEKTHDPTPRRLEEARRQGDFPRSQELISAAALAGFVAALLGPARSAADRIGDLLRQLLETRAGPADLPGLGWTPALQAPVTGILWALAPVFLLPLAAALLCVAAQRALIFRPVAVLPKWSRISPISALKHRFGPDGLLSFATQLAKVGLVLPLLWFYLARRIDLVLGAAALTPAGGLGLLVELSMGLMFLALAVAAVLGAADYLFQRVRFLARNRMTRQELIEEMRESEGSPETKSRRRQKAEEIATNRMMLDVQKSSVVIVNPTHYAVALRWEKGKDRAPVCLAKGTDAIAARIRAKAIEAGIPIRSDPPTARALHAQVELGQEIPAQHYRAAAAAIRFAEAMRKRVGQR